MKLDSSFSVRAPIDEVWAALLDVERVAPCLPGARVIDRHGDDVYEVQFDVAVGEQSASYEGRLSILEREADERRAVLSLTAEADRRRRAEARFELTVLQDGELTEGRLAGDLWLGAEAAALDEEAITGRIERLIDRFTRNLAAMLGGGLPTVNGADPESSVARMPAEVGEAPPGSRPIKVAPAAAARAQSAEPVAEPQPESAGAEEPFAPGSAYTGPSAGEGSWAGATRQAGATIDRLRSPLGAMLVVLVAAGALLGRRRSARRARSVAGESAGPPPSESAAEPAA